MKRKLFLVLTMLTATMLTSCTKKAETETKVEVRQYPSVAIVVDVNYENNVVALQDSNGEILAFTGTEDWMVGDVAALIMSDNGTEKVYDDEIIDARYSSFDLHGKEWMLCH